MLRRSFKYTKLQERKLFEDTILLHSWKLTIPVDAADQRKTKTFTSDILSLGTADATSAKAFVKVIN